MATNLEYIYSLKDQFSKKLALIAKRQVQFTNAYTKSMGKLNAASIAHQKVLKRTAQVYNNHKQAMNRSKESIERLKEAQVRYHKVTSTGIRSLTRYQQDYNSSLSKTNSLLSRVRAPGGGGVRAPGGGSERLPATNIMGKMQGITNTMLGSIFNIRNAIVGLGSAYMGSKLLQMPLQQASFFEDQLITMGVLLRGNKKRAKELVAELQQKGAETPFEFKDLSQTVTTMLSFGAATEKNVIKKMMMLGDIAQGDAQKLQQVAYAFSQISAFGKLRGQERMQLVNAGVPLEEMAKNMGMTLKKMDKLQSKGLITASMVEKSLMKMTQKGGLFYNMMIEKSKTFSGLTSTLKDNFNLTTAAIGEGMLPEAKKLAIYLIGVSQKVRTWAQNSDELRQKSKMLFQKLTSGVKWVVENFDDLVDYAKMAGKAILTLLAVNTFLKFSKFSKEVFSLGKDFAVLAKKIWLAVFAQRALNKTSGGAGKYIPGVGGSVVSKGMMSTIKSSIVGLAVKVVAAISSGILAIPAAIAATVLSAIGIGRNMAKTQGMAKEINKLTSMRNVDLSDNQRNFAMNRTRMLGMMRMSGIQSAPMEMPKKAVDMRNFVENQKIKATTSGEIRVKADPGTEVTGQEFDFNLGGNMMFGGLSG